MTASTAEAMLRHLDALHHLRGCAAVTAPTGVTAVAEVDVHGRVTALTLDENLRPHRVGDVSTVILQAVRSATAEACERADIAREQLLAELARTLR